MATGTLAKAQGKGYIFLKIEVEDHGQDFTHFIVDPKTKKIVDTLPLQGRVWNGKKVVMGTVAPGNLLCLKGVEGFKNYYLKHPIVSVQEIDTRPPTKNELVLLLHLYRGHGVVNPYVITNPTTHGVNITLRRLERYSINGGDPKAYRDVGGLYRKELLVKVSTEKLSAWRKRYGFDRLEPGETAYRISEKGLRLVRPLFLAEELESLKKCLENNELRYLKKKLQLERQIRYLKRKVAEAQQVSEGDRR